MEVESLIKIILDEAFHVHKSLGPGLLESVYQRCLSHRLRERGLVVETEKKIPVVFDDVRMECGFRADIVVENQVVIETKSIEAIGDIHIAQTLTYLRFLEIRHGLILNFRTVLLKNGIKRVLNGY